MYSIQDVSKKTGLSISVAKRLVECNRDGESPVVDDWSVILSSPLFDSVHEDWKFITGAIYDKILLEARLAALNWEKDYLLAKGISRNDEDIFEVPYDSDVEISTVRDNIASKDAAFYGMLSKLSKNFADFIERNAKAHYEASKEEITVHELRIMQQWYKSISL